MSDRSDERRKRRRLERLHSGLAILVLLAIPTTGLIVSLGEDDWTWFARSGAAMVGVSVLWFSQLYISDSIVSLRGTSRPPINVVLIKRLLAELKNPGEPLPRKALLKDVEKLLSHEEEEAKRIGDALASVDRSVTEYRRAAAGAFFGTWIWGFGDLAGIWL